MRMGKYIFFEVNPFDCQTNPVGIGAAKPAFPPSQASFLCVTNRHHNSHSRHTGIEGGLYTGHSVKSSRLHLIGTSY